MRKTLISTVAVVLIAAGIVTFAHGRNTLWRIVSEECPAASAPDSPAGKCVRANGTDAVLKDKRGVLQYLLIPTTRITGIEDDQLSRSKTPYFEDAWDARRYMEKLHGAAIPANDVSVALNSRWSRSQDQLHLHVSCVRSDLKARLASLHLPAGVWSDLPGGWNGHAYRVLLTKGSDLAAEEPIAEVRADGVAPGDNLGSQSIAVVGQGGPTTPPALWILHSHNDPLHGWLGGIEGDVQDHTCAVLPKS